MPPGLDHADALEDVPLVLQRGEGRHLGQRVDVERLPDSIWRRGDYFPIVLLPFLFNMVALLVALAVVSLVARRTSN